MADDIEHLALMQDYLNNALTFHYVVAGFVILFGIVRIVLAIKKNIILNLRAGLMVVFYIIFITLYVIDLVLLILVVSHFKYYKNE